MPSQPGFLNKVVSYIGTLPIRLGMNYDSVRWSPARGKIVHTAPSDLKREQTPADRWELLRLMRYLDKNNGFVSAYVNAHLTYGVGDGFRYQPLTGNPAWNAQAKRYVEGVMNRPELTGRFNGVQFTKTAGKAQIIDGDIFFIKTRHPQNGMPCVQAIEAHRVRNPSGRPPEEKWIDGILFDSVGRPITYAVQQDDGSFTFYGAGSVIHLYELDRFTGARGISRLQVAVSTLRDRAEVLSAEKLAVKELSRRTFTLKSQDGEFDPSDAGIMGRTPVRPSTGQTTANDVASAFGGLAIALGPNESLEAFEHNRPNMNVLGMLDFLDRDAANSTGISSDFLLNPTKIGGAVVRMELAKAERQFSAFQSMLIDGLLRPFIQYAIADAIATGKLPAVEGWERMTFQTPKRLSVDVGRDTLAMLRLLELGGINLRDIIEQEGKEYEAEVIARLDDKVWATEQAAARGLTYDDVSLTSILSKEQEQPKQPAQAQPSPVMDSEDDNGEDEESPEEEAEERSEQNT